MKVVFHYDKDSGTESWFAQRPLVLVMFFSATQLCGQLYITYRRVVDEVLRSIGPKFFHALTKYSMIVSGPVISCFLPYLGSIGIIVSDNEADGPVIRMRQIFNLKYLVKLINKMMFAWWPIYEQIFRQWIRTGVTWVLEMQFLR